MEKELAIEKQRIKNWFNTGKRLYETVSNRSGLKGQGYRFKDDKNENKKKDLKNIFVKVGIDKPVVISRTFSTNIVCDEKVTSHEEKKTEKVLIKKTDKDKNDIKGTTVDTQKKVTGKNVGLMTKGQFRKKLGEITCKPEPRTTPKRNRNWKQGICKANNYEYIPFAPRKRCYNCDSCIHLAIDCTINRK